MFPVMNEQVTEEGATPVNLAGLGWNAFFEAHLAEVATSSTVAARVIEQLKDFYRVHDGKREYLAELGGKFRYTAEDKNDLPAVGDWVTITVRRAENRARIEGILPRRTKLSRKVAGRAISEQVVATNLDIVFIVSALNQEFNARRIERYLTLVWDSGARPVILLNKADLCVDADRIATEVETLALGASVHLVCAVSGQGMQEMKQHLTPGVTAAFVGSSGVGKSTIINGLIGHQQIRVQPVRESDDRGKHTTTTRQMFFLPGGGVVIDTPGMRELQLWDNGDGLDKAFGDIRDLARECRFRDCSHEGEPGCAVEAAVAGGTLNPERLESHRKLKAELRFLERKADPALAREEKERWKAIHKAMRHNPKG
jgi:ribosome biogenesis GTPase / thiamine phosphate phosphatase